MSRTGSESLFPNNAGRAIPAAVLVREEPDEEEEEDEDEEKDGDDEESENDGYSE